MGLPLEEVLRTTTYRQYKMWQIYFERDMDIPTRSDFYSMQIVAELRSVIQAFAGIRNAINLNDFIIKFEEKKKPKERRKYTDEERASITARIKARWRGMITAVTRGK